MKENLYIIKRASNRDMDIPPCKGAEHAKVHYFYDIRKHGDMRWYYNLVRDVVEFGEDGLHGVRKEPDNVWVCEVTDFRALVKEVGFDIILSEPDNEEGIWEIEIYDDYIE